MGYTRKSVAYTTYFFMALTSILFLFACKGPASTLETGSDTGSITGVVATRGTSITVEAQHVDGQISRVANADADGRYTLDDLEPGTYRIYASAPGYSRSTGNSAIEVLAEQTVPADRIVLNWTGIGVPTATITGIVTDADSGLPVEGVFVNVACDPNEIICLGRSSFTDAQGRYMISSIPPDFGFDLFIGKTDYPNHLERGHLLGSDQTQILDIQIRR